MKILSVVMQLIGSLGLLLYGMKMMSDGIQKSAGQSLHKVLGLMTSNRFFAVLTGMFVTMLIQSSGATTVMVVSFVNAGLMTLAQSVGVIFGANIGTTITAWIVTIFGFTFKISSIALPVIGIGFFLTFIKKVGDIKLENIGESLMGFGMLFLGLDFLSRAITISPENVSFLTVLNGGGAISLFSGVLISAVITMILHSSSAFTAIVITMAATNLLSWEFSAALVLGSNVGSTIDAVLAAIGTKVNARRTALIHVLFNISGTLIAIIFLRPLLTFVDWITPGTVESNMTMHVAMLHTIFNLFSTLLFIPFTTQLAALTERIIKPKEGETPSVYKLDFVESIGRGNAESYIMQAEKEISDMALLAIKMFARIQKGFVERSTHFITDHMDRLAAKEEYADQMQEQLTRFLVHCSELPINDIQRNNISMMLRIVDDIESMTDDCYSLALLLQRSIEKKMEFDEKELERLGPYMDLVHCCLQFMIDHINKPLSKAQLEEAAVIEDQIDTYRKQLKKIARKNLEQGADVKTELLYIDLIRHIEKIGDHAFSISESLAETR